MNLKKDLSERELPPIIIIAGATATGKTELAVKIAENIGGEIVSADSMQVYKYMDIGTAKPSKEEMRGVPHYLIDEIYPDEVFNVSVFKELSDIYINSIHNKGKTPIIVGGTGFYINAVTKQTEFNEAPANEELRAHYGRLAEKYGASYVHGILKNVDPISAYNIHENNIKRVVRAIEYYYSTGEPISVHNRKERAKASGVNYKMFILDMDRVALYEKINKRVNIMIEKGLVAEVEALLNMGYTDDLVSMQGIGYKEIIKHLCGECSLDSAIEMVKKNSRNYAKRQVTWFKNQTNGVVINAGDTEHIVSQIQY